MFALDQFRQTYIAECEELLVQMEAHLARMEQGECDTELLNAIFRCAHSIKGGAGAFDLHAIVRFTHVLENLLDVMRAGVVPPTHELAGLLLEAADILNQMVADAKAGITTDGTYGQHVLVRLNGYLETEEGSHGASGVEPAAGEAAGNEAGSSVSDKQHWRIRFVPHETLFMSGNDPLLILRELAQLGALTLQPDMSRMPTWDELVAVHAYLAWDITLETTATESDIRDVFAFVDGLCDLHIQSQPQEQTARKTTHASVGQDSNKPSVVQETSPAIRTEPGGSIRVDLEKIDRLVNMVGELVITQAMLQAQTRDLSFDQYAGILSGVEELSQHTRELQEAVMAVRMQPVKSIFSRMPRLLRDIARQLGKDIRLVTSGEETEVDKTVIEQLTDPLTHMIRNAADHGVEMPEVRIEKGKPAQGTVHLSAYHQGGRMFIELRDDGAGINRERILQKAKEKGILSADATLRDDEIDNLIFHPGFSTAEAVTNISGRGVGMDVVKRNIEAMGGYVSLHSQPGQGSCFTISLPLTLAILDGMIVRIGQEFYIIPITHILETLRPQAGQVRTIPDGQDVLNVRGVFVPMLYLHRLFHITQAEQQPDKALIVLVEAGRETLGLVVDELVGQQQVVIKSLETNADPVTGISGATILGDGKVSLILDIPALVSLQHRYLVQHRHREHQSITC